VKPTVCLTPSLTHPNPDLSLTNPNPDPGNLALTRILSATTRRAGLVVVKPDEELVSDYCGALLAHALGVAQPEMRLVRLADSEGQQIVQALTRLDAAKPIKERSQPPIGELLANVPAVVVMNFVKGRSLKGAALAAYMESFERPDAPPQPSTFCVSTFGPPGELSDVGRARLRAIGRMMAFDILIFNYDRLPCVFDNGGNTENIMFGDDGEVIAIDSMVSCFAIDEPAARTLFDAFCGRVSELVSSASAQPDVPQPAFEAVRALVRRPRHTRTKARRRRCTTPSRCRPGVGATCVAPCARARGARRVCMRLTRAACTAPADIVCVRCVNVCVCVCVPGPLSLSSLSAAQGARRRELRGLLPAPPL